MSQSIYYVEQQKAAWFESDFCVSGAPYISTLFTMDIFFCP